MLTIQKLQITGAVALTPSPWKQQKVFKNLCKSSPLNAPLVQGMVLPESCNINSQLDTDWETERRKMNTQVFKGNTLKESPKNTDRHFSASPYSTLRDMTLFCESWSISISDVSDLSKAIQEVCDRTSHRC